MPTLNWIGKDKIVNYAAAVPFHVLEHIYNFGSAKSSAKSAKNIDYKV